MGGGSRGAGNHLTSDIEHRYIDVGDGLRLHLAVSGTGPPLVLLHGFTGSADSWTTVRRLLDGELTVIALDLAGHGGSSAPADPSRYSAERFNRDLDSVCRELGVGRIALMGYSMGGRFALRFALAHPERLSALILESTSPGISDPGARKARLESDAELARSIETDGIEKFVEYWESLSLWESQRSLPLARRSELRAQRLRNHPRGLANSLRAAGAASMAALTEADLRSLEVPTLSIAGELDEPYAAHARAMHEHIAGSQLEIIEGAGHAVHFEKPDLLASAVRRFLLDSQREQQQYSKESS